MSGQAPDKFISAVMLGYPCPNDHDKRVSDCVLAGIKVCTVCQSYETVAPALRAQGMREAAKCQPVTAENPNETSYERGRFDGIIEFGTAIITRAAELEKEQEK